MANSEAYFVTSGVLDEFELGSIVQETQNKIMKVVLGQESPNDTRLLTDHTLRKKLLSNPKQIWGNGNTRDAKLPKGTGTPNIYLDKTHLDMRTCDSVVSAIKKVHNKFLYESELTEDLMLPIFRHLDKLVYKPNGTVDGPVQTEPGTIVSMLILSIHNFDKNKKTKINKKSTGSPSILLGYREYKDFILAYLNWERTDLKTFFSNLKRYNDIVYSYHLWRNDCDPVDFGLPDLPEHFKTKEFDFVTEWKGLHWFNIPCKEGDMISWYGDIPWKMEKNSTPTPFLGLYLTTLEASLDWYDSDSRNNIKTSLETGIVGKNSARQSEYNGDELKVIGTYRNIIPQLSETQRLLLGIDKYTELCT